LKNYLPIFLFIFSFSVGFVIKANCQESNSPRDSISGLNNPVTVSYLDEHLLKTTPRLVLNSTIKEKLKNELKINPVVKNLYDAIRLNADEILGKPLLERKLEGRRMLNVSREMLYRVNMLGMVYSLEKDQQILRRMNEEVIAVCSFTDWNPGHFLDVAEMSLAVALAVDWTDGDLPKETVDLAQVSLIEKALKPSWPANGDTLWWAYGTNNWTQVCHGGLIAASIAIAEKAPELAAKTINRALDGLPQVLASYAPDGVYPEGASYWEYGTSYSVVTIAMLESAFGTDFELAEFPGFKESAVFRKLMNAPSGMYYNFSDCSDKRRRQGDIILAWFAKETGNSIYYEKNRFLMPANEMGRLSRLSGAGLVWLSQFKEKKEGKLPEVWKGDGVNPVAVFTGGDEDPHTYYFGCKGGKATINHGNMDAGSFVFELNGVRWVYDLGVGLGYNSIEKTGFDLWDNCQDCDRWKLLTKNNFGHSTISVNDQLFINEGYAPIVDFQEGVNPEVTFDLSAVFGNNLKSCKRTFIKDGSESLIIEDQIEVSDKTELITWQLLTTADVELHKGKAILKQDSKKLRVELLSHPELTFSVVSLSPPPTELDPNVEGLRRLEIRLPAWILSNEKKEIVRVRLSGV